MEPAVQEGDNLHIMTRRAFAGDVRRHFVGTVEAGEGSLVRARGYVFVHNEGTGEFERRETPRVRIFGLTDAMQIVNVLPRELDVASTHYAVARGRLVFTDGGAFELDINELGPLT